MRSPLIVDVARLRHSGTADVIHQEGPAPARIGVDMIAIDEGSPLIVDATLTPINGAVMVEGTVACEVHGQCSRCLGDITADETFSVSAVFADNADFFDSDDAKDAGDDETDEDDDIFYPLNNERLDMLDALIDEAGLALPFNPVCEDYNLDCEDSDVPAPDGVSGEEPDEPPIDPRWAGLEKFT